MVARWKRSVNFTKCAQVLAEPELWSRSVGCIRFSDDFLSEESDVYNSLGNHLIEHHFLSDKADFGATYEVFIFINSSPSNLEVNEHHGAGKRDRRFLFPPN